MQAHRFEEAHVSDGWRDPGRVADYLAREIPHRDVAEAMLLQALPPQVERFVDLGTGNGRLIALVREHHPDARALGIDFSEPMLAHAGERFAGDPLIELRQHDLARPLAIQEPVDAVLSGLAIHHLEDARKRALFGEIQALLRPGGVFVNLDLVMAANSKQHERFRLAIGRQEDDPADRLADLCEQLRWMREAGFADADCQFKWLQLALLVGTRSQ
jgi:tRNA (cmo5U34)-methyltransferase